MGMLRNGSLRFWQDWRFKIDCTAFLCYFIGQYPNSVEEVRGADKSFWKRFK